MNPLINIVIPTSPYVTDEPFKGDLFERKQLAERLTSYIGRIQGSCVIAINAPWGDGKTWFGRNWERYLVQSGYRTAYVDAFASDYSTDPFWLITSAISAQIEGEEKKQITRAAASVAKAALPFATKVLITALANKLVGTTNLDDLLGDLGAGDKAEKIIEDQMEKHEQNTKSIESFKATIRAYTSTLEKPLVVFVDELDRCAPEFAVRLLERIKHFFDVEKAIFVLLINQEQLEEAIRGVYGHNINASAYLNKFINVIFNLPKRIAIENGDSDYNREYCWALAHKYGFIELEGGGAFVRILCKLAKPFKLSYRDLERAFTLFALAYPVSKNDYRAGAITWLIVLKLKMPDIYLKITNGDNEGHQKAVQLFGFVEAGEKDEFYRQTMIAMQTIHRGHVGGNFRSEDFQIEQIVRQIGMNLHNSYQIIPNLVRRIDVAMTVSG